MAKRKMRIPPAAQIHGIRKALANPRTPKQFKPALRKRLAKLLVIAFLLFVPARRTLGQAIPDPHLTPGAVRTTDKAKICGTKTSSVRHTSQSLKKKICAEYVVSPCPAEGLMEIDHLVALELGGADVAANLWVQLAPDFHKKDALENKLHEMVCSGQIGVVQAQTEIRTDWRTAYRKYIGPLPPEEKN